MSPWQPIKDYPIEPGPQGASGPLVLARTADKQPMVVLMNNGIFYPCPGVPIFYGHHQVGFMTVSNLVEFMDIPA